MNQTKLAKKLGIRQSTVSHWVNGKSKPTGLPKERLLQHSPELYQFWKEKYPDLYKE